MIGVKLNDAIIVNTLVTLLKIVQLLMNHHVENVAATIGLTPATLNKRNASTVSGKMLLIQITQPSITNAQLW